MGTRWIPGAERLGDGSIGGSMDTPGLPPRVTWHSTESGNGNAAFNAVRDYLINIGAEPHILYDPATDRLGQYGPLDQSARALRNDGTSRTNRTGHVNIQIEVLARAKTPFTGYWKPGKNFRALMAAIRSWKIPDRFPMGAPPVYPGGTKRTRAVWLNQAGHYCHANVPGNDHGDPGAISVSKLFAAAGGSKPGKKWIVKAGQTMGAIAAAVGITLASLIGANPQVKNPDRIQPGQELNLPEEAKPPKPTTPTKPKPTKPTKPTTAPYPGRDKVSYQASGPHVLAVDKALVRKGYGRYLSSGPSSYYGKTTRAGVKAFQINQGWTGADADGNVGPETWRRLLR
ncbi:peptidoglycan-binding protein [Streptomyces sp. H27-C3]|uniref:peptidoglycan-binding protein n=1 Tax=Streptomyces sp. H27-C3 TaxID=3046305 RepID=UPI0024BB447B|nr:peptidoglycan-binding protein [Streptomyces sp. H27-C3]MDJ0463186.1 peptidoglycan-binding protein [Streptomyces sp. H27-C3]